MWSTDRSESLLSVQDGLPVPLLVRPMRTARRLRLRFDPVRQLLKLTCPPRTSKRAAVQWVLEQRDWIELQMAEAAEAEPLRPGAVIPLGGAEVALEWDEAAPRQPVLKDGVLRCGGPLEGFPRRIETYLKRLALETLSRETAEMARAIDVAAKQVSIGDADSRWGSCSSALRIRYSWRLILAPVEARRFVVAHEVAHLVHLNHGAQFKRLERQLFGGDVAPARALLRRLGPRLKRIGRGR